MIHVSVTDGVGLLELDRPAQRNALDVEQCHRLVAAVAQVRAQGARAIVVTGRGSSFCSGADCGPWTVRRLAQVAGGGTARAILLACEQVGADLALARGLVDRISDTGDVSEALALAAEIAVLAPLTLAYNKLALDRDALPFDDPELVAAFERCWASADLEEGRRARTEQRRPVFDGR